jgi:hypothetical protein
MTQYIKKSICDKMFLKTGDDASIYDLNSHMEAVGNWYSRDSFHGLKDHHINGLAKFLNDNDGNESMDSSLMDAVRSAHQRATQGADAHTIMSDIDHLHLLTSRAKPADALAMASYLKSQESKFAGIDCLDTSMTQLTTKAMYAAAAVEHSTDFETKFGCSIADTIHDRNNHEIITFCHNMQNLEQYGTLVDSVETTGHHDL